MQSMLNVAQSSDMAKDESMMLQIDNNKQLSHETEGLGSCFSSFQNNLATVSWGRDFFNHPPPQLLYV